MLCNMPQIYFYNMRYTFLHYEKQKGNAKSMVHSNYGNSPVLPFIIITKCTEQRAALPDVRNAKNQPESLCCFFFFFALFIFAQAREINYYATFRSHSSTLSKKIQQEKTTTQYAAYAETTETSARLGHGSAKGIQDAHRTLPLLLLRVCAPAQKPVHKLSIINMQNLCICV